MEEKEKVCIKWMDVFFETFLGTNISPPSMCLKMIILFRLVGYLSFLEDKVSYENTGFFSMSIFVLPADVVFENEKLPPMRPVFDHWTLNIARGGIIRLKG